jgi:hypothetical protein
LLNLSETVLGLTREVDAKYIWILGAYVVSFLEMEGIDAYRNGCFLEPMGDISSTNISEYIKGIVRNCYVGWMGTPLV